MAFKKLYLLATLLATALSEPGYHEPHILQDQLYPQQPPQQQYQEIITYLTPSQIRSLHSNEQTLMYDPRSQTMTIQRNSPHPKDQQQQHKIPTQQLKQPIFTPHNIVEQEALPKYQGLPTKEAQMFSPSPYFVERIKNQQNEKQQTFKQAELLKLDNQNKTLQTTLAMIDEIKQAEKLVQAIQDNFEKEIQQESQVKDEKVRQVANDQDLRRIQAQHLKNLHQEAQSQQLNKDLQQETTSQELRDFQQQNQQVEFKQLQQDAQNQQLIKHLQQEALSQEWRDSEQQKQVKELKQVQQETQSQFIKQLQQETNSQEWENSHKENLHEELKNLQQDAHNQEWTHSQQQAQNEELLKNLHQESENQALRHLQHESQKQALLNHLNEEAQIQQLRQSQQQFHYNLNQEQYEQEFKREQYEQSFPQYYPRNQNEFELIPYRYQLEKEHQKLGQLLLDDQVRITSNMPKPSPQKPEPSHEKLLITLQENHKPAENNKPPQTDFIPLTYAPRFNEEKYAFAKHLSDVVKKNVEIEKLRSEALAEEIRNSPPVVVDQEVKIIRRRPVTITTTKNVPVPAPYLVQVPKPYEVKVPQPYPVPLEILKPFFVPVVKTEKIEVEKPVPYEVEKRVPVEVEKKVYVKVDKPYTVERIVPVEITQKVPVEIPVYKPQKVTILRHVWKH